MAKQTKLATTLVRWSEHVPVSDVQDPLGLSLRISARLASQLLFCITSVTPRARYFSFIPWCVQDWQKRERGQGYAFELREAIKLREKALTLGCVAHHNGKSCDGGFLVGSDFVIEWYAKKHLEIDLRKLPFARNPALSVYLNSLVNLGVFLTDEERPDSDEEDESATFTINDLELSPLGKQLADAYDSLIARLESVRALASAQRHCTVRSLSELGKRGGLCELSQDTAHDRQLLRDIFFAQVQLRGESHPVRNRSLSLLLELSRQLSADAWILDEDNFALAVYFDELVSGDDDHLDITWPKTLVDIATRWRMFYFHYYMSVALEGMFAWLVTQVSQKGLGGVSIDELADTLCSKTVPKPMSELLALVIGPDFGDSTPADIFRQYLSTFQELDAETSSLLDRQIRPTNRFCEHRLEEVIRDRKYLQSPVGLALPMLLLALTLARYRQWEETKYGNWLANATNDPYLDLAPPVLTMGLSRHFGSWWKCTWKELAEYVLGRYVLQQHQSMSYEKTSRGERCLLQTDGNKVTTQPNEVYEKIGMSNPRFRSAIRILKDLGLLTVTPDGVTTLTHDGSRLLEKQLSEENRE